MGRTDVESAEQMLEAVMGRVADTDIFIGVAAVADYRPATIQAEKIKKNADSMTLALVKNPDIISRVAALSDGPMVVGFAAETEHLEANGTEKLKRKGLDLLFANKATETFNSDEVTVTALSNTASKPSDPAAS